jgi:hypothetical protein
MVVGFTAATSLFVVGVVKGFGRDAAEQADAWFITAALIAVLTAIVGRLLRPKRK